MRTLMLGVVMLGSGCTLYFEDGTGPSPSSSPRDAAADGPGSAANPVDTSLPRISRVTPDRAALDVLPTVAVHAEFTKVVRISASSFVLRRNGNSVPGTVSFDAPTLTATFQPNAPLIPYATYEAAITRGVVDLDGKALATETRWTFTIKDRTDDAAPILVSFSPDRDATSVDLGATVTAVFNEPMSGPPDGIQLTAGSSPVAGHVDYVLAPPRAIFRPDALLASNTLYAVTLTPRLTDLEGNAFGGAPVSWRFTTMTAPLDTVAPRVVSNTPANGATEVGSTPLISVTFDEPVVMVNPTTFTLRPWSGGGTVAATVTYDAATRTAVLRPAQPLPLSGACEFTATVSDSITDLAGNHLVAKSWTFDTAYFGGGC